MHLEVDDFGHPDGAIEVDVERAEYLGHVHRLQTWRYIHTHVYSHTHMHMCISCACLLQTCYYHCSLTSTYYVLTADAQRHARALKLARSDGAVAVQVPCTEELQQPRRVRAERRQQLW